MTYLLLEGEFAENTKIQGLSDKAFRLHVTGLTHCARNLTDGAISEIDLRKLAAISAIARPNVVITQLQTAGLWEPNGSGWIIHDYLEHNPSRRELLEKRAKARSRKRRWRNAQGNAGQSPGQNAAGTRHKPPSRRLPSNDGKPPAGDAPARTPSPADTCPDCGEKLGHGHLDTCPRMPALAPEPAASPS